MKRICLILLALLMPAAGLAQNTVTTTQAANPIVTHRSMPLTFTSGTLTDSAPALNITQTWNDAADTFIGASMDITNTSSAAASKLFDWRIGGVSLASVGPGTNTNGVFRVGTIAASSASIVAFSALTTYPAAATTTIEGFRSSPTVSDGSGATFTQVVGYRAVNATKSGGADTITKQVGFQANSMTSGAANYGFEGALLVSGSARHNLYMSGTAPNYLNGPLLMGADASAITASAGSIGMAKITASGSAPGAGGSKFEVVCGTNAGTAKLQMYAGTSATPVTVIDNVGSGVTGC